MKKPDWSKMDKTAIRQFYKNHKKQKRRALTIIVDELIIAVDIANLVHVHTTRQALKDFAVKNLIVNSISCLEVYLKSIIKEKSRHWSKTGINQLLSDQVTLGKAFEIITEAKITQADLVAKISSFNNIQTIDFVFSKLTGKHFLKELKTHMLEKVKREIDEECLDRIPVIFEMRNKIVHERTIKVIGYKKALGYIINILEFAHCIDDFVTIRRKLTKKQEQELYNNMGLGHFNLSSFNNENSFIYQPAFPLDGVTR